MNGAIEALYFALLEFVFLAQTRLFYLRAPDRRAVTTTAARAERRCFISGSIPVNNLSLWKEICCVVYVSEIFHFFVAAARKMQDLSASPVERRGKRL